MESQYLQPENLRIRLFGLNGCEKCQKLLAQFKQARFTFSYWDADHNDCQTMCDEQNVDEVPHVQLLKLNDEVLRNLIGDNAKFEDVLVAIKSFSQADLSL